MVDRLMTSVTRGPHLAIRVFKLRTILILDHIAELQMRSILYGLEDALQIDLFAGVVFANGDDSNCRPEM